MTLEELKQAGAIYVEYIRDGLEQYENEIITMQEIEAGQFFLKELHNKNQNLFLDFYYFTLDEQARSRVDGKLTGEERAWLSAFPHEEGAFIFPAAEELIRIAVKLNAEEMLFSSFYIAGQDGSASIWWGNYGEEYVVMRKKGI